MKTFYNVIDTLFAFNNGLLAKCWLAWRDGDRELKTVPEVDNLPVRSTMTTLFSDVERDQAGRYVDIRLGLQKYI